MIVLGIDPGLTGGLALIESGRPPRLLEARSIPTVGENAKRRVDTAKVLAFLQKHSIDHGFIERAQAMPRDGGSSAFIYGRATGSLEACMSGMQIPWRTVEPTAWKTTHGLMKTGKKESRQRAISLFGFEFFPLAEHHGRAEAALIAWHGMMSLQVKISSGVPVLPNP